MGPHQIKTPHGTPSCHECVQTKLLGIDILGPKGYQGRIRGPLIDLEGSLYAEQSGYELLNSQ